jgi:hypothetical protein
VTILHGIGYLTGATFEAQRRRGSHDSEDMARRTGSELPKGEMGNGRVRALLISRYPARPAARY